MEENSISNEDLDGIYKDLGSTLRQYIKFIEWVDKETKNKRSKLIYLIKINL